MKTYKDMDDFEKEDVQEWNGNCIHHPIYNSHAWLLVKRE